MTSSLVLGQFLWHELLTSDPDGGAEFYSKVLGWKSRPWEGEAGYTMLASSAGPVGGARVVGKDPLASTAGPNWLTYVGVPDLAIALATAQGSGGRVLHPISSIPDGGRYAVIADPQGAIIGLYEPAGDMGDSSGAPASGPVVWHELTAEDPVAALQFYKELFGWDRVAQHEMGAEVGTYYLFGHGETQMGGVYKRPAQLPSGWPRWLVYLGVPALTAAVTAVEAAGGQILNGPMEVPGGSWVAQIVDSHGVPIALHGARDAAPAPEPKAKARAKPKAPAKPKVSATPKAAAVPRAKTKTKAKVATKPRPVIKAKTKTKTKLKAKPVSKSRVAVKKTPAPKSKAKAVVRTRRKAVSRVAVKAARKKSPALKKTAAKSGSRVKPRRGK